MIQETENHDVLAQLEEADLILVGLGEEFDQLGILKENGEYISGKTKLEEQGLHWLIPSYDARYRQKLQPEKEAEMRSCLKQLAQLLDGKNYFVVSTAVNDMIAETPWKEGRLVTPCGGSRKKQCVDGCVEGLMEVTETDRKAIEDFLQILQDKSEQDNREIDADKSLEMVSLLGICPKCGKPLILNNIYAAEYDENGYLPQWQLYTKWLQGTLNKKLIVLELGVGMKFPSVIRWPFEKITFFNNKAHIYRVNEKLYQLSEELKGKGTAIPKNFIDWLNSLC